MDPTRMRPVTRCRSCGVEVYARLVVCPECGGCCPGCTTSGLEILDSEPLPSKLKALARSSPCGKLLAMHHELGHALMEPLWELDNLPGNTDEAVSRIFAVTDDLEKAIRATRELDKLVE